jgi:NAD(P)-dependent dehydrogenase (short-subunit alcohol dehydrogenase family)
MTAAPAASATTAATTSKTAAVTGAGSGIGRETCRALLAGGWRVFALDVAQVSLDTLAADMAGLGELHILRCDASDAASVNAAFAVVRHDTPRLDALICSAGVLRTGPLLDMSVEDFDQVFAVNTRGPWLCAKAAAPLLRAGASAAEPARIIMVGSISALRPKVNGGVYAASKSALSRLVRVMAVELAADHILVNAVAPGTVDTPMVAAAGVAGYRPSGVSPLGRVAQPADVTAVMLMLLRPEMNYVTGTWIPVDGGTSAAFVPAP